MDESIAREKTLAYFNGDEIATAVWLGKYALRDSDGVLLEETPTDMHRRLAKEFARIEAKYPNPMGEDEIFELLDGFKYVVPQGSPMSGIGNDYKIQSLSNCFVIPSPLDSYAGILHTDQQQVQIMKRRGGVGFDVSNIRPRGLLTANAAGSTDGISIFLERFSNSCREVAQSGRRGALMLTIDCRHPEIETFIAIKKDLTKVTGANISIRVSDSFMKAVESDSEFTLQWPVESDSPTVIRTVKAKDIWQQMMEAAHGMAEPGILFWDTVIENSPADCYSENGFKSTSTNPCAELVLSAYDSCRLIALNVFSYVKNPFSDAANFDFELWAKHVIKAQRLMDDLVDLELEKVDEIIEKIKADPEPGEIKQIELDLWTKIREVAQAGRRTGLGVTAVGDAIAALGMRYGSPESIEFVDGLYQALAMYANESSVIMGEERGAFPVWYENPTAYYGNAYMERLIEASDYVDPTIEERLWKTGRRNIALLTTAPTGSLSCLTQTTSGIEPVFRVSYTRRKKINPLDTDARVDFVDGVGDKWQEFEIYHHKYKQWMETPNAIPDPYAEATSDKVDWVSGVKLQGAAQKWVDHAISKTCNLPADTTVETVSDVYLAAWKEGCKGFTVYRDGCRSGVLVTEEPEAAAPNFASHTAPKRPESLPCRVHRATIKGESWTILVGLLDGRPYEVFGGLSTHIEIPKRYVDGVLIKLPRKTGKSVYDLVLGEGDDALKVKNVAKQFENPDFAYATRLISLALRHGADIQFVVEQLQKEKESDMFSFSKCLARVLKEYVVDGTVSSHSCTQCGSEGLVYQEGCLTCTACGWSKCS